jgi:hypothetical protein
MTIKGIVHKWCHAPRGEEDETFVMMCDVAKGVRNMMSQKS